jgi:hypothetical protein
VQAFQYLVLLAREWGTWAAKTADALSAAMYWAQVQHGGSAAGGGTETGNGGNIRGGANTLDWQQQLRRRMQQLRTPCDAVCRCWQLLRSGCMVVRTAQDSQCATNAQLHQRHLMLCRGMLEEEGRTGASVREECMDDLDTVASSSPADSTAAARRPADQRLL